MYKLYDPVWFDATQATPIFGALELPPSSQWIDGAFIEDLGDDRLDIQVWTKVADTGEAKPQRYAVPRAAVKSRT